MSRRDFLKLISAAGVIAGSGQLLFAGQFQIVSTADARNRELIRLHDRVRGGNKFWCKSPEPSHAASVVALYSFMVSNFPDPRNSDSYRFDEDETDIVEAYCCIDPRTLQDDLSEFPDYMISYAINIRMMNLKAHVRTPEFEPLHNEITGRYAV